LLASKIYNFCDWLSNYLLIIGLFAFGIYLLKDWKMQKKFQRFIVIFLLIFIVFLVGFNCFSLVFDWWVFVIKGYTDLIVYQTISIVVCLILMSSVIYFNFKKI
jgi:hypothetical protein